MATRSDIAATDEIQRLQAELTHHEQESAAKALQLERYAADLRETFKQERARAQELRRSYMATVRALSNAVEARDAYTGEHAERVAAYGMEIARALGLELTEEPEIEFGFLLHDIGQGGDPRCDPPQARKADREGSGADGADPVIGSEIVRGIDFLGEAAKIVHSHHERWDGTGYPDGLSGEEIPLRTAPPRRCAWHAR